MVVIVGVIVVVGGVAFGVLGCEVLSSPDRLRVSGVRFLVPRDRAPVQRSNPAAASSLPGSRPASSVQRSRPDCFLRFGLLGNLDTSPIWPVSWPWSDFLDSGGKCIGKIEIIQYRLCFGALLGYGYRKGDPTPSAAKRRGYPSPQFTNFFGKIF